MDNDHIITPEGSGISRRQMLAGAGVLALGYGVGQMMTGPATAFGQDAVPPSGVNTGAGLPWPDAFSDQDTINEACRKAAIRGFNQFNRAGG